MLLYACVGSGHKKGHQVKSGKLTEEQAEEWAVEKAKEAGKRAADEFDGRRNEPCWAAPSLSRSHRQYFVPLVLVLSLFHSHRAKGTDKKGNIDELLQAIVVLISGHRGQHRGRYVCRQGSGMDWRAAR